MARKTWEPRAYPFRDPRKPTQQVGRIVNPPRTLKFAGKGEARIWDPDAKQRGTEGPTGKGPVSDRGKGGANPI